MTDNTKSIFMKLQADKREPAIRKVFLGDFVYAEFMPYKGSVKVRLTDEDGCGRVMDTIMLDEEQVDKLVREYCASH